MKQQYCISAKCRETKFTSSITGPMSKEDADEWKPTSLHKRLYTYFRVAKHPFKSHKK